MAGNQNSGGMRPTAPQNNPANISATGGAGQSGKQPSRYISGMPYGQGQQLMQQQKSAPMSAPVTQKGEMGGFSAAEPLTPFVRRGEAGGTLLDPKSGPMGHITDGVDFGRGVGSDALPKNVSGETRTTDNLEVIKKYFPAMLRASQLQDAPDSYKRWISYLSGQI